MHVFEVFIKTDPIWEVGYHKPSSEQRLLNEIRRLVGKAISAKNGEWLGLVNIDTAEGIIDRERAIGAASALEAVLGALNGRPGKLAGMSS